MKQPSIGIVTRTSKTVTPRDKNGHMIF
jgi:hypothetical protein